MLDFIITHGKFHLLSPRRHYAMIAGRSGFIDDYIRDATSLQNATSHTAIRAI